MSKLEQKTTSGCSGRDQKPPNPTPPPGEGWSLRGGSSQPREHGIVHHYWYWEREVQECEQGAEDGLEHLTQA